MTSFIRTLHALLYDDIRKSLDELREQNPDEFEREELRIREKEINIEMIGTQKMEFDNELTMCFICKEPLEDPLITFCCKKLICNICFPENGSKRCCPQHCKIFELVEPSGFFLRKLKTVMFKCTAEECQV